MIENQEKLVKEIVRRVIKTPYIIQYIPLEDIEEWINDLRLIVLCAVVNHEVNHENHVVEEETLS